ncbi:MAG: hypothetical protein WA966_05810, partial [Ornithinimicrobium sp.]
MTLAATSGLALSTAGSSQDAPAAPKSPASKGLAFTPAAAAVVAPATTPVPTRVLPTPSGYTTYRWGSRGGSVRTIQ